MHMYIDVSNLRSAVTTRDSNTITWDVTTNPYCGDVSYIATITGSAQWPTIDQHHRTALFSNLSNSTTYTITLTATNKAGDRIAVIY